MYFKSSSSRRRTFRSDKNAKTKPTNQHRQKQKQTNK